MNIEERIRMVEDKYSIYETEQTTNYVLFIFKGTITGNIRDAQFLYDIGLSVVQMGPYSMLCRIEES